MMEEKADLCLYTHIVAVSLSFVKQSCLLFGDSFIHRMSPPPPLSTCGLTSLSIILWTGFLYGRELAWKTNQLYETCQHMFGTNTFVTNNVTLGRSILSPVLLLQLH